MKPEVTQEHAWLRHLIGNWRIEGGEGHSGEETYEALGDVWVVGRGKGTMGDDQMEFQVVLGYDTAKGKFVGSWIGSPMNMQWVYEGERDETGNALHLYCEGPNFDGSPGTSTYRDSYVMVTPDHRRQISAVRGADGEWQEFMRSDHYRV